MSTQLEKTKTKVEVLAEYIRENPSASHRDLQGTCDRSGPETCQIPGVDMQQQLEPKADKSGWTIETKYALVVLGIDSLSTDRQNDVYTGFETEDRAYAYAASLLVRHGQISHAGAAGFFFEGAFFESAKDVVVSYQEDLIGSEYFHVFQCIEYSSRGSDATTT